MVNSLKRVLLTIGVFQLLFFVTIPVWPTLIRLLRLLPDWLGVVLNIGLIVGVIVGSAEIAQRLMGDKKRGKETAAPAPTPSGSGLDPADLDVALRAKDELLRIRRALPRIADPTTTAALDEISRIADEGLASLAAEPEKMRRLRRPVAYHLPKAAELAEGLAAIADQPDQDARAARIGAVLTDLAESFRAYRDGALAPDTRNLDVEIRLLENALASERTARLAANLSSGAG